MVVKAFEVSLCFSFLFLYLTSTHANAGSSQEIGISLKLTGIVDELLRLEDMMKERWGESRRSLPLIIILLEILCLF